MTEASNAEIRNRLGNIVQLRELLFGDLLDAYNSRLEQYHQRLNHLEDNFQQSQSAIENNLQELEKKILHRISLIANTLNQRIKYSQLEPQKKYQELEQHLNTISQYSHENIDFLYKGLDTNTNSLKKEITQVKSDLEKEISLFKQALSSQLETQLSELTTHQISRADLADVLGELSRKFKDTKPDSDPDSDPNDPSFPETQC